MADNIPTLDEWSKLYEAASRVKELAPWEWMTETDIFGVQNPETNVLGFVSVMGLLGEHYAVAVYLGPTGLYGFWELQNASPFDPPERLLEIPQLQASFENRNQLHNKDREIIKKLGLKFRGRHSWPMFRSFRPGFVPWFLEAAEVRFLTYVLDQIQGEDFSLMEPPDDESYLVHVPRQEGGTLAWEDRIMHVPPPEPSPISIGMNVQVLKDLKRRRRSQHKIEVDFFLVPAPIEEKRGLRPYYPYVLMVVEAQSGMILGHDMLKAEPSIEAMWGTIPMNLVQQLVRAGIVPKEVRVRSPVLFQLLKPLAEELHFKLKQSPTLPSLDSSKEFLLRGFM